MTASDDHARFAGDFESDLTDDLTGLEPKSLAALVDWRKFYMQHKVGRHHSTCV